MLKDYEKVITDCIKFAQKFLYLPGELNVCFDMCPSERFPSMNNAAESDRNNIYINQQWFERSMPEHQDDVEFYIFHELRHIHQFISIEKMLNEEACQDSYEEIKQWKYNFEHYIRNIDEMTQKQNLIQEVEVDANAYGISLLNLYYMNKGVFNPRFQYSLPEEAYRIGDIRSRKYYETKYELKQFVEKMRTKYIQNRQSLRSPLNVKEPVKVPKPGRNSLCPCGSGKKFKHCCIGKGIYD